MNMRIMIDGGLLLAMLFIAAGCASSEAEKMAESNKAGAIKSGSSAPPLFASRAYIDPVTKELITPSAEKLNRNSGLTIISPVIHSEIQQADGSAILVPNFKPSHSLIMNKHCGGKLVVAHAEAGALNTQNNNCVKGNISGEQP